jgi:3-oxoadipate enol-lactonase
MELHQPHSTIVDTGRRESAPWLTMVHAATHDQRYFASQVQSFQKDFRLLLIDLPGHGKSTSLPGPYGFEEYAVSVRAAMDAAGVDSTHYLGTHTGAAVGIMLACRDPQRIQSLALESAPIPGLDLPSVTQAYNRARATARSSGVEAARREWLEQGLWFANIRENLQRRRAEEHRAMVSDFSGRPWLDTAPAAPVTPLLEQLASIRCPVLIINGEHDVEDFLRAADEIERRVPRARRVSIPHTGGFPMWEAPELVDDHLRRHLHEARAKP